MHSRQRQPARPSRAVALGGRVYENQPPRSLARWRKRKGRCCRCRRSMAAKLAYILPFLPLPVSLSPRCGGAADGGLSLFAKSTCNFRMFSRRPPSSSFFPFFVCFALAAFLPPKEIQWPAAAGAPLSLARYFLRPVCFFVPLRFAKGTPVKLPVVPTRCAGVFFLRVELESMEL